MAPKNEPTVEEEVLLSRREAARLARVHPNTVKNVWERNGWITRIEVLNGRQMEVRYRKSEIEALIVQRQVTRNQDYLPDTESTRLAALEAENVLLREELDRLRKEHSTLLQEILKRSR